MKPALRSRLLLLAVAATVLVIDQLSKAWVIAHLPEYTSVDWIPWLQPLISLTYVKNTGIAFGLFPGLGLLATVLSLVVVIGVFVFQNSIPPADVWVHLALGLVTGGALGNNVIDRPLRGFVIDFFDVNFWPFREWPVFNVADSAIVVGVTILLVDALFCEYREMRQRSGETPPCELQAEVGHDG